MANIIKIYLSDLYKKTINSISKILFFDKKNEAHIYFLKNLTYVATGTLVGTGLIFILNILVGRFLGPVEYGKFVLINSIAMFLYVPMIFGLSTAMVKYNAEKVDFHRQQSIISTSYILILIFTIASTCLYMIFSSKIALIFSVSTDLLYFAILFAILFALYTLTTNTLRGLHKMKIFSLLKSLYGIIPLVSFLVFLMVCYTSFKSIVFSMYLAYGTISLVVLYTIHKYLTLQFDTFWMKILIKYGALNLFTSASYMLHTNIDKILINKYMMMNDIGLYNAYSVSSIRIMAMFSGILVAVLFPTISKYKNKKNIIKQVNQYVPYLAIFGFIIITISQFVILPLYGKEYPINLPLIVLFSLTSVLFFTYELYAWILNSIGIKGVKITMLGTGAIAITNISFNLYLIPRFGLYGAITSTTIAYCIGMLVIYNKRNKAF